MGRKEKQPVNETLAVAYIRVSTEEQKLGPGAQREQISRYCEAHGLTLVETFVDHGVSGGAPLDKRPGLMATFEAVKAHRAGVVVVAKRDRLARDVFLSAMFERLAQKEGASIHAANGAGNGDTPEAVMMRGIVDVFAQYERALIRSRTKAALAQRKAKGKKTGGAVPYGYTLASDGETLHQNPTEQATITEILALRSQGLTYRAMGAALKDRGIFPRGGGRWHPTTLSRIVKAHRKDKAAA